MMVFAPPPSRRRWTRPYAAFDYADRDRNPVLIWPTASSAP
ncbi:MAG: hypothetical protein ACLRWQ_02005 [Flavonifractor plautii]